MTRVFSAVVLATVTLGGCTSVPQQAITANQQVSKGIAAIGDNGLAMVDAWEHSAYAMLDERWHKVYTKAEQSYRGKRQLADNDNLNSQQREDVAGLAALIRTQVRGSIHDEADRMRRTIHGNVQATLEANESITELLISANSVLSLQQSAIKEVGDLLPIPPTISTFIDKSLQSAGL